MAELRDVVFDRELVRGADGPELDDVVGGFHRALMRRVLLVHLLSCAFGLFLQQFDSMILVPERLFKHGGLHDFLLPALIALLGDLLLGLRRRLIDVFPPSLPHALAVLLPVALCLVSGMLHDGLVTLLILLVVESIIIVGWVFKGLGVHASGSIAMCTLGHRFLGVQASVDILILMGHHRCPAALDCYAQLRWRGQLRCGPESWSFLGAFI